MCEYFRVPEENAKFDTLLLPDNVSFEAGSLLEPIACTMRGVKITPIRPGDTVVVIGMGFIGLSFLELIRHTPAGKIIVMDLNEWRLEQGRKHGATHTINPGKVDPVETVKEINDGRLADAVFVAVPSIQVWDQGLSLCEKGATIHFGTPLHPDIQWPINPNKLWFSEIKLNFTYSTTHVETAAVLDMIAAGRLDAESLITHRFGLDQVPEAIQLYMQLAESTDNKLAIEVIQPKPVILLGSGWHKLMETFFAEFGDYVPMDDRQYLAFAPEPQAALELLTNFLGLA